jgi:ATP-dependent Clp protease adaptor protein ClpS
MLQVIAFQNTLAAGAQATSVGRVLALSPPVSMAGGTGAPGNSNPGDNNNDDNGDGGSKTGLVTKTRPKTKKPSLYRVLLLNDDFTPMEFVTHVLQKYFNKSREEAERIMLHVHQKGVGICGVYTYEVAETKVTQVMDFSRKNSHPLQCTMEKE